MVYLNYNNLDEETQEYFNKSYKTFEFSEVFFIGIFKIRRSTLPHFSKSYRTSLKQVI